MGRKAEGKGKKLYNVNHKNLLLSNGAAWQWWVRPTLHISLPSIVFLSTFLLQVSAIRGQYISQWTLVTSLLCAALTGNPHTDLWTALAVEEKPSDTSPPKQKSSWFNSVILAQKKFNILLLHVLLSLSRTGCSVPSFGLFAACSSSIQFYQRKVICYASAVFKNGIFHNRIFGQLNISQIYCQFPVLDFSNF